jgi:hypothetical protein
MIYQIAIVSPPSVPMKNAFIVFLSSKENLVRIGGKSSRFAKQMSNGKYY